MSTGGSTTTSSGGNGGDVNVRVVPFSGQRGEWEDWKDKFAVKVMITCTYQS